MSLQITIIGVGIYGEQIDQTFSTASEALDWLEEALEEGDLCQEDR